MASALRSLKSSQDESEHAANDAPKYPGVLGAATTSSSVMTSAELLSSTVAKSDVLEAASDAFSNAAANNLHNIPTNTRLTTTSSVDTSSLLGVVTEAAKRNQNSNVHEATCEVNMNDCKANETCVPYGGRRRDGLCQCMDGLERSHDTGLCQVSQTQKTDAVVPVTVVASKDETMEGSAFSNNETYTTHAPPRALDVSVNNKTVILPEGSSVYEQKVRLSAYVIGGKLSITITVYLLCFISNSMFLFILCILYK